MTPTCYFRCAVASIVVTFAFGKIVTSTDRSDDQMGEPSSVTPSTTERYSKKHLANWFDEYEDSDDDDDDDGQYYDDETEDDLQSDYLREPFLSGYSPNNDAQTPSKKVHQFWSSYRPNYRTRTHHGTEDLKGQEEVKKHHERVKEDYQCRTPQPRVVRVLDQYPSTTKTYLPTCTVLHQCSESTGCCPSNERCGPKKTGKLELTFFALFNVADLSPHHGRRVRKTETLVFYNHTECECQVRGDEMPRDVLPTPDPPEAALSHFSKCHCPTPFNLRLLQGAQCACDCFDKQRDCIKFKKGKDYLNHEARLCIEMRKCLTPLCDYGNYIRRSGRCPRKDEKFRY